MFPAAADQRLAFFCFMLQDWQLVAFAKTILAMKNWIMQMIPSTTSQLVQFTANQESWNLWTPNKEQWHSLWQHAPPASQPYSTSRAQSAHLVVDNDVYHNNNKLWLPMFEMCWETVGLGSQNSERKLAHLWDRKSGISPGKACHHRCVFDPAVH